MRSGYGGAQYRAVKGADYHVFCLPCISSASSHWFGWGLENKKDVNKDKNRENCIVKVPPPEPHYLAIPIANMDSKNSDSVQARSLVRMRHGPSFIRMHGATS